MIDDVPHFLIKQMIYRYYICYILSTLIVFTYWASRKIGGLNKLFCVIAAKMSWAKRQWKYLRSNVLGVSLPFLTTKVVLLSHVLAVVVAFAPTA